MVFPSTSTMTRIALMLCAGGALVGNAVADEAPPPPAPTVASQTPPPPPPPGMRMERRVVVIDHDGNDEAMGGRDSRHREMFIMGDDEEGHPGRRMMRGMGPEGLRGPGGRHGADMMLRVARELGLTPEQRTAMRGIMQAARPKMDELRGQIRAQKLKLREADPNAKDYDAVVASGAKRIGELTAQRVQMRAQLKRQAWQLLTPEQRAKAAAMQAEAKKRRDAQADRMERRARQLRGTP